MFQDLYLKFDSEEKAKSVLYSLEPGIPDEEGNPGESWIKPNYQNIDIVGVMHLDAPDPIPEDYIPEAMEGWHVNVRVLEGEDASVLEPFSVQPQSPRRVWG